ncbi:DUF5011 domain-containing protein [Patescibacteria group bacterium]|nr:MAG: DUF5011 domain-containing protein [Patescibacteria group bacterium]
MRRSLLTRARNTAAAALIVSLLFANLAFFYPRETEAISILGSGDVPVSEGKLREKETGKGGLLSVLSRLGIPTSLDGLAWVAAKVAASAITQSITNWAKRGFEGGPLFATDPEQFFLGVGDVVAGDFIRSSGFGALCSPFRLEVQQAIALNYNSSRIRSRDPYIGSCTLSGVVQNVDQFIKGDFSQGGWGGWYQLTQTPQGNPYSAVLDAQAQLSVRLAGEKSIELTRLNWADGFLSFSDCLERDDFADAQSGMTGSGKCLKRGPTKTPGVVIEEGLNQVLGTKQRSLEVADELDETIGAVIDAIIGKVLGEVFGGSGLFNGQQLSGGSGGVAIPGSPATLTIFLADPNPMTLSVGDAYIEPGYVALDPNEGSLTGQVVVSGIVDTSVPGTYNLTYTVTNSSGQTAQAIRTIIVQPSVTGPGGGFPFGPITNTPPVVTLNDPKTMNLKVGDTYNEPGFVATDAEDGDITSRVTVSGTVDTNTSGLYSLRYDVTDLVGDRAQTQIRLIFVNP